MGIVAVSLRSAIQPTTRNAMIHKKYDFTEHTTADLERILDFSTAMLETHKEAIKHEPDPEQRNAFTDHILFLEDGIAQVKAELQTR